MAESTSVPTYPKCRRALGLSVNRVCKRTRFDRESNLRSSASSAHAISTEPSLSCSVVFFRFSNNQFYWCHPSVPQTRITSLSVHAKVSCNLSHFISSKILCGHCVPEHHLSNQLSQKWTYPLCRALKISYEAFLHLEKKSKTHT